MSGMHTTFGHGCLGVAGTGFGSSRHNIPSAIVSLICKAMCLHVLLKRAMYTTLVHFGN